MNIELHGFDPQAALYNKERLQLAVSQVFGVEQVDVRFTISEKESWNREGTKLPFLRAYCADGDDTDLEKILDEVSDLKGLNGQPLRLEIIGLSGLKLVVPPS